MTSKYKELSILILISLSVLTTIPTIENNSSLNSFQPFSFYLGLGTSYSTFYDQQQGLLNIYTVSYEQSELFFFNYTISNSQIPSVGSNYLFLSELYGFQPNIVNINYFISNYTQFLAISTNNNTGSYFNIFTLGKQSKNYSISDNSDYTLVSINRFSNSPDVYFSLYNDTTFFIIKYSFETNSYITFFSTSSLPIGSVKVFYVSFFMLDNKIYTSVVTGNRTVIGVNGSFPIYSYSNLNSWIYILNTNGILFSKNFPTFDLNAFTSLDKGLLLYSSLNSTYFMYSYSNQSFDVFNPLIPNSVNSSVFKPFDNQSFLILNNNNFEFVSLQNNGNAGYTYQENAIYYFQDYYDPFSHNIQALSTGTEKYYIFSLVNYQFSTEILLNNVNNALPSDVLNTSSYTPPNGTFTTSGTLLANQYASTSTSTITSTDIGMISPSILFFIIIAVIISIGTVFFIYRKKSYQVYSSQGSKTNIIKNNLNNTYSINICRFCRNRTREGDIFCENCGKRL